MKQVSINTLKKSECAAVIKKVTGELGDFPRITHDEYRQKLTLLRKENPYLVDRAIVQILGLETDEPLSVTESLELAVRFLLGLIDEHGLPAGVNPDHVASDIEAVRAALVRARP